MALQTLPDCYLRHHWQQLVKLTSINIKNRISPQVARFDPVSEPSEHLLCLSSKESLMLFQLLQAALLHPPMREGLLGQSEYNQFHRELSGALASALTGRPQAQSIQAGGHGG